MRELVLGAAALARGCGGAFRPAPKSEKEKMLAGELYRASDPEILRDQAARCALRLFLFGSHKRTGLDSADDGRHVLLEIDEMILAEQDCRSAGLPGQDHQDLVKVNQHFPRRRSRSFQYDKVSHIQPQWLKAVSPCGPV
jgi:Maltose acetyltransferase